MADVLIGEFVRRATSPPPRTNVSDVERSFLADIDYGKYLAVLSFRYDTAVAERLRTTLNARSTSGDVGNRFLLLLADAYYREYPADYYKRSGSKTTASRWLAIKADIGAHYIETLAPQYGKSDARARVLYELIGTYTLFQVASHIDQEIATGALDPANVKAAIDTVRRLGVPVATPKGDLRKAWEYFHRGDIDKLFERGLSSTFTEYYSRIVKDSYTIKRQSPSCNVETATLIGREFGNIATAHTLDRRKFTATYAARQASARITLPANTVIALSASYTDKDGTPYGFTAIKGDVRNEAISRRMDALVRIDGGDVVVTDLRAGIRCQNQLLQPLTSLPDYYCYMLCVRNGRQSVFQTHLLYAGGIPAFNPAAAPVNENRKIERRERRILALLSDRYIIFDVPRACTMSEATFLFEKMLDGLQIPRANVQAAINLDTGTFDILDVFCPSGRLMSSKNRRSADATNLIIFTTR